MRLRTTWLWPATVGLLFCLPLFVGLGRTDLESDEAIYSFAADVMAETGDWLVPRSCPSEDTPFLEKPPLKFWIVAAPIRLGLLPDNEFGLRFWDALFGAAAFLYVFAIGRGLGGPVAGLAAVLVLVVHRPLVVEHGLRSNNMEAALVLAYCGAIYHAMKWRLSGNGGRSRAHVLALTLYFVLGFMTKFVAALFLPLVVAVALLSNRDSRGRVIREWRIWMAAAGVAAVLVVPWFVYGYFRFGATFARDVFGDAVYTRLTSYVDPQHVQPWHFYLTTLWSQLVASRAAAWVILGAILILWRAIRKGWADGVMVLLWFVLPVGIISLGTSKLYHYIYPFLPPLALAAGYGVATAWGALMWVVEWLQARVERLPGGAWRRLTGMRAVRWTLAGIAVIGSAAAAAALVLDGFKLALGGHVLFRVSTPVRALALAVLAVVLLRRGRLLRAVVVSLVLALVLPIGVYRGEVAALRVERHPLRSIRDCLRPIVAASTGPRVGAPVYVEGSNISHPAAFYLRTLGHWKLESRSDATLFSALYQERRPAVLSTARYYEFDKWLAGRQAAGAGQDGIDARALAAAVRPTALPAVMLKDELLILPGPYGVCASAADANRRH